MHRPGTAASDASSSAEQVQFRVAVFVEELLVHYCSPISIAYLYCAYGPRAVNNKSFNLFHCKRGMLHASLARNANGIGGVISSGGGTTTSTWFCVGAPGVQNWKKKQKKRERKREKQQEQDFHAP